MLVAALLPSIFSDMKPPAKTSALTALVVASFAIAFFSLKLWLSFSAEVASCISWLILCAQVLSKRLVK